MSCSLVSVAAGACRQAPCRSTASHCCGRGWELEWQLSLAFQRKLLSTVSVVSEDEGLLVIAVMKLIQS